MNKPVRLVAIDVHDMSFAYGDKPVIGNCDLQVVRGRVLALLGPNGSGKTTLLKLIAGALQPNSGTVVRNGRVGYVPQFMQLSFAYSVLDIVLMGRARQIGTFATPSKHDREQAMNALRRVGLENFASRSFDELSGGERQLVTFARALASEADVLVLDEPTASLDLRHQQLVLKWIRRLSRDEGLTVVFSTHYPQHADVVADDAALIYGPGNIEFGARDRVLDAERVGALFGVEMQRTIRHDVALDDDSLRGDLQVRWNL